MHEATKLAPPEFVPMLLAISAALFILGSVVMLKRPDPSGRVNIIDALVPFAIPVGVIGVTVLVITGIGWLLLVVGNSILVEVPGFRPVTMAVPVALALAVIVLGVCGALARGGASPDGGAAERH